MAFSGDTVRLKVQFKTFEGTLIDPTNVTLTIYGSDEQQIEQFNLTDNDKETVGIYFYDYVIPADKDSIIFEFAGSYNNKPILIRDEVKIQFTK